MFKQPPPAPSTAAIRALRGLIFGTSCTFALVAEDRRRRINGARAVLRNAERLKSDKRYYAGGAAAALALEEDRLFDPAVIEGMRKDGTLPTRRHTHPSRRRLEKALGVAADPTDAIRAESYRSPSTAEHDVHDKRPLRQQGRKLASPSTAFHHVILQPLSENTLPRARPIQGNPLAADDAQTANSPNLLALRSFVAHIDGIAGSRDRREIPDAIQSLRRVLDSQAAPWDAPAQFLTVSTELCILCQELGLMDEAATVLQLVVDKLQLDGPAYFAHRPLPVIEHLLPPETCDIEDSSPPGTCGVESSKTPMTKDRRRQASFLEKLDMAERLFLPERNGSSRSYQSAPAAVTELGRKLLERAFNVGSMDHIRRTFSKLANASADLSDILPWYFGRLKDTRSHPWIIRSFLMLPEKQPFSSPCLWRLDDLVVGAVVASHGLLAADVLRRLLENTRGQYQLRSSPVCELLYQHWKKTRNFEEVSELFSELLGDSVADKVQHVDGPYRTMVQIALEAGENEKAEAYVRQLTSLAPESARGIRIQGLFAKAKAKKGDWVGVRDVFERISQEDRRSFKRSGAVLVPLLGEFARTHTIRETEQWLKDYIDNIGVPVCREMVTLMGREYGDRREHESFVAWLDYCVQSGLVVDAAFSNTILRNCWKNWRFPFKRLGCLYKKLCLLSPRFEDDVTRRIMAGAALTKQAVSSKSGLARLKWLGLDVDNSISRGRCSNEEEVYLAMKAEAQRTGPQRAAWVYKQALKAGMPPSEKCLKLMVALSTRRGGTGKVAKHLLDMAKAKGDDVNGAAAHLVVRELKGINATSVNRQDVLREIQAAIRPFEKSGVKLNGMVLNRAARIAFASRDVHNATLLGLEAAKLAGKAPGYNLNNFTTLLWCFSLQLNADGIEMVVRNFADSGDLRWGNCIFVLRRANAMILEFARNAKTAQALIAVRRGLRLAEQELARFQEVCTKVEASSVALMQDAARRAGNEPVDLDGFVDLQWTRSSRQAESPDEVVDEVSTHGREESYLDPLGQLVAQTAEFQGRHRPAGRAAF